VLHRNNYLWDREWLSNRTAVREKTADVEVKGEFWKWKELRKTNLMGAILGNLQDWKKPAGNIACYIH